MRNRWEDKADVDEPVTLTERQLRSLKLGARAGLFALVLAIVAAGLAGWTTIRAGKLESGMNPSVASANQQPTPEQGGEAQAATETPASAPGTVAPSVASAPAASAPVVQAATPAAQTSKPAATTTRKTKAAGGAAWPKVAAPAARSKEPVTESFDPSPAAPAMASPITSPAPIPAESPKPAAQDSSAAHH